MITALRAEVRVLGTNSALASAVQRKDGPMALQREQIIAGKCYVDGDKDRYKVLEINERGIVSYRMHGSPLRHSTGVKAFAKGMIEEIACPEGL